MDREIAIEVRRGRRIKRIAVAALVLVGAAGLVALASSWLSPSIHRSRTRFAHVERGDIESTISAAGTVVPAYERVVSSPLAARVERVLRKPGDVIARGEPILELDTSATRLEIERSDERLAQNRNERVRLGLELERRVSEIESSIESRRLDADIARFRLDQKRRLSADGLIAEDELKEAEVTLEKAEIEIRRLTEDLSAERRLDAARLEQLALDADILSKERDDARRRLELATTAAPVAGVLTSVVEDEGASVGEGEVLARIADLDSFRVEARMSDAWASQLAAGQDAWVVAGDERLAARVAAVSPTVEAGTIEFTLDLDDDAHPVLRRSLRVDVHVVTGRRSDVLVAPRGPYIQGGGDRHRVFVVDSDRALRTDVTIGLVGHERCEIVDGLAEGDEIIVSDVREWLHARQVRLK
jgi:HlyD family secretion protein